MDYVSAQQAADRWGIKVRRVQKLCEDGRIKDVVRFGHSWMIPKDAEKPGDARKTRHKKGGRDSQK